MQKIKAPTEEDRIYLYILFLTFLYHDYYYYQEQNKELEPIDNFETEFKKIAGLKDIYSPSNINKYYKYRGKSDHGIYAGYQLNRKLKSNLDEILNGEEVVIRNNLSWSKKDIKYYDFASSAIIKHNIWLANRNRVSEVQKKRVNEYESKDLNPFIISNKDRMKFEDNPLLFILFIIDSIEPIKIFNKNRNEHNKNNYNNLLSNILININQKSITLRYADSFKSIGCFTFCEAKQMETWLDVTVTQKCNEDYFELSIRFNS